MVIYFVNYRSKYQPKYYNTLLYTKSVRYFATEIKAPEWIPKNQTYNYNESKNSLRDLFNVYMNQSRNRNYVIAAAIVLLTTFFRKTELLTLSKEEKQI